MAAATPTSRGTSSVFVVKTRKKRKDGPSRSLTPMVHSALTEWEMSAAAACTKSSTSAPTSMCPECFHESLCTKCVSHPFAVGRRAAWKLQSGVFIPPPAGPRRTYLYARQI